MNEDARAVFSERIACINCGGNKLQELSTGRFDEGVLKRFIEEDPWGEHPEPFLRGQNWSYVACQDCGQSFHRYILAPDWNERRFAKWMSQEAIEAFEKRTKTPAYEFRKATDYTAHIFRIERLTRELRGSGAPRLLDFGCGYGEFLSMCAMYGFDAYGVDRSTAKRDNNHFSRVFPEIENVSGMAPFHAITLFEVLEHLDDPRGLMLRLRDLLPSGGILVLETPDCSGVRNIETRHDYDKIHPLEHINGFTPDTLTQFAVRLGFSPIARPLACVTNDLGKVIKSVAKRLLSPLMRPTTQLYLHKL